MDSNNYQQLAARTLIDRPEQPLTADEIAMLTQALKMSACVGALVERLKKQILHRHSAYSKQDYLVDLQKLRASFNHVSSPIRIDTAHDSLSSKDTMVLWNIIGLLGESSELAELLLDYDLEPCRDTGIYSDAHQEWTKELGDVAWYHAAIATKLGLKISGIQQANIEKLKKRFPEGFTTQDSVARVDAESPKDLGQILGQVQQDLGGRVTIEPMSKVSPVTLIDDGAQEWD